ncbi:hypothetical protein [Microbispora sp. NPDC046933]|uniref:hypothetical protein n=1 Tax=Microbispora sp. NPDC046933 TaxID=3155618 RepID=UPI0033FBC3FB
MTPDGTRLIAEVKRVRPARRRRAASDRPRSTAAEYVTGGAAAISLLTEPRHSGGSPDDLRAVREVVSVPLLSEDVVLHPCRLAEAAVARADVAGADVVGVDVAGADMVLPIVAALSGRQGSPRINDGARSPGR